MLLVLNCHVKQEVVSAEQVDKEEETGVSSHSDLFGSSVLNEES